MRQCFLKWKVQGVERMVQCSTERLIGDAKDDIAAELPPQEDQQNGIHQQQDKYHWIKRPKFSSKQHLQRKNQPWDKAEHDEAKHPASWKEKRSFGEQATHAENEKGNGNTAQEEGR